ncbi:hypothetical protein [Aliivibrio logei]|uniref:Uncharacterized protein n=1 Tax=Aliivibrio logei TaxID=688 RepID=A0A1B9NUB6_ALILO|nr:hypothetical protein [Aliivibrio logei]OCH17622.1 hypothetical protein A6E04_18550 [Aliivibrio logei]
MPILVVKPSVNVPNEPQFKDIIISRMASGFFASKKSADNCLIIIITDGISCKAGRIVSVTEKLVPPKSQNAKKWIKRIDVTFDSVRNLSFQEKTQISAINWSSRNVRFI